MKDLKKMNLYKIQINDKACDFTLSKKEAWIDAFVAEFIGNVIIEIETHDFIFGDDPYYHIITKDRVKIPRLYDSLKRFNKYVDDEYGFVLRIGNTKNETLKQEISNIIKSKKKYKLKVIVSKIFYPLGIGSQIYPSLEISDVLSSSIIE